MATRIDSLHRFTVEQYHRMGELGILPERGVELMDGAVVFAGGRRWHFTLEDYYRMAEAGVLHEADRVELIGGEVIDMSPTGSRHAGCIKRLLALLAPRLAEQAIVSVQDPLQLPGGGEPVPDMMLLRPRVDFYSEAHPAPPDVLLLIEVADSSLAWDQSEKAHLYARSGIAEYWLVDLTQTIVLIHTAPSGIGYLTVRSLARGERCTPLLLPGLALDTSEIFG